MARVLKPMVAKRIPVTKGRVPGFLAFGPDNLFPQTLLDVIDDSDTASAAMSVRSEFIEGNGFADVTLAEMIVNRKGETLDDILASTAANVGWSEVECYHLAYNGLGQIVGLQTIPVEQIRFMEPDDLGNITRAGIFPYLGSTLYPKKKDEHKVVFMFNPDPMVVLAQIEAVGGIEHYYGQIIYNPAGIKRGEIYHIPSYAGGTVAFETEAELTKGDYRLATTDLVSPGFIKGLKAKRGNKDAESDSDSLTNRVTQHQGAENAGSVFVIEADSVEELDAIKFESMAGNDLANRNSSMIDRTAERISRRTRVPNELMGVRKSTGGISFTQIQIKLFSQLMQQTVNRYQRTITRTLTTIFAHWHVPIVDRDFTIENLNYFPDDKNGTVAQPL